MDGLPQPLVEKVLYKLAEAYADGIVETAFARKPFHTSLQERKDALTEAVMNSDHRVVLESHARYLLSDLIHELKG